MEGKKDELKGQAKEALGDATDNEQWQSEGKADQAKGNAKQSVDKARDAAQSLKP